LRRKFGRKRTKVGDPCGVNVQLINAANDSHIGRDTFDRKLTTFFRSKVKSPKPSPSQYGQR
jgi:TolB-like protein